MLSDLQIAIASLEDFYRRIYWQAGQAITHSRPEYTLSYSGLPWLHSNNQLWLHRLDALNDEVLALAQDFFGRYNAEYSITFNDPGQPEIISWLANRQYVE